MMVRNPLRFGAWIGLALACVALAAAGPSAAERARAKNPLDYPMVGDNSGMDGMLPMKVEGIGLVVGLDQTGSDPPPNRYREFMLDQMKKREIADPSLLLASPETSIVLLRSFIPPGARKGDLIDVEVWVPPGDQTTSLRGGRLLEASMAENLIAGNRTLDGNDLLKVEGPVLVTRNPSDSKDTAALKKGRILGRGRVLVDYDFRLVLPRESRSGKRTKDLAVRINQRFFSIDAGRRTGLANAKDDKVIELKLASRYRHNVQRYLLVVRRIPMSMSDTFTQSLLEILQDELLDPEGCIDAALRLEALGDIAIPVLTKGLTSSHTPVQFAAAQSLAYLGDASAVPVLAEMAANQPLYRAFALAALSAVEYPSSRVELTKLMQSPSAETRYGAFRALWCFDRRDPVVVGESLYDAPTIELLNDTGRARKIDRDQYQVASLHAINVEGPPMVHLASNFRQEIVLFGSQQKMQSPLSLRAGDRMILTASPGADSIHIAYFSKSTKGTDQRRAVCDTKLANVIREMVRLGATYPDLVEMLQQADHNGNLEGRLEINALPQATRLETLENIVRSENAKQDRPNEGGVPNLFTAAAESRSTGIVSVDEPQLEPDAEDASSSKKSPRRKGILNLFRRHAD